MFKGSKMWTFDARSRSDTVCPLGVVVLVTLVGPSLASDVVDGEAGDVGRHSAVGIGRWVGIGM